MLSLKKICILKLNTQLDYLNHESKVLIIMKIILLTKYVDWIV